MQENSSPKVLINSVTNDEAIVTCKCVEHFVENLTPEGRNAFRSVSSNDIVKLLDGIDMSPHMFVYLFIKPQPSKKQTRYMAVLDSNKLLHTVNLSTNEFLTLGTVQNFQHKSKRNVLFEMGEKKPRLFTVKQPFIKLHEVLYSFTKMDGVVPVLDQFLLPFLELPDEAPKDIPPALVPILKASFKKLITSPNTEFIQALQNVSLPPRVITALGDFFAVLCIRQNTIGYVLRTLLPVCMKNISNTSMILRSENIVTRMLNYIRNQYCSEYIETLYTTIEDQFKSLNSTEEFVPAFINVLRTIPAPPIIRWLMSIIFRSAEVRFPDEPQAPYNAISNFLLLRGLGPRLSTRDAAMQVRFSFLTMLFNFSPNPNIAGFAQELKDILKQMAISPNQNEDITLSVEENVIDEMVPQIMKIFAVQAKEIYDVYKQAPPMDYKSGVQYFIDEVCENAQ